MDLFGFDPEDVQFLFPAITPAQTSAPIFSILLGFKVDSSLSTF